MVDDARAREAELEAVCVDEPADPDGRWHAKDQLAHLSWWRGRTARVLKFVHDGGEAPPDSPDDTAQNAVIYAQTKDRSAADVKRDATTTWSAVRTALEACTDEDLAKPHPNHPEARAWEAIPGMGGHIGSHLMSWWLDSGDVGRAEAAARWAYELECSLLPEGEKRADASYNLACFFARTGRVDEALRLLRDSIPFSPELASWAREDRDLDGIRDDPRVRELLAG